MKEIEQKKCIQILSTDDGKDVGKYVAGIENMQLKTVSDFEFSLKFSDSLDLQNFVKNYMLHEKCNVVNYCVRTFYNIKNTP